MHPAVLSSQGISIAGYSDPLAGTLVSRRRCDPRRCRTCRRRCGSDSHAQPKRAGAASPRGDGLLLDARSSVRDHERTGDRALALRQPPRRLGLAGHGKRGRGANRPPSAVATVDADTRLPHGALLRFYAHRVLRRQRSASPSLESPATDCLLAAAECSGAPPHRLASAPATAGGGGLRSARTGPRKTIEFVSAGCPRAADGRFVRASAGTI